MFLKALGCEPDVIPKAMMNLGLLYNTKGNFLAQTGDMSSVYYPKLLVRGCHPHSSQNLQSSYRQTPARHTSSTNTFKYI